MKKILFAALLLLLTACTNAPGADEGSASESEVLESSVTSSETPGSPEESTEQTKDSVIFATSNDELYSVFLEEWKTGSVIRAFPYTSDTIKSFLSVDDFQSMFCDVFTHVTGNFVDVKNETTVKSGDTYIYKGTLVFVDDMVEMNFELSLSKVRIEGFYYDLRFKDSYLITDDGIEVNYFLLASRDYLLNAAYVQAPQKDAPVALLIPGSGPVDYNETIGLLPTFQDLALGLAKEGISSLRVEKRTFRYGSSYKETDGLEEEYFQDLDAAYAWLEKKNATNNVWLLGHSLGVNIAAEFANRHPVNGMILWNGSARHLAEIAADQYVRMLPSSAESYRQLAKGAMAVTKDNCDGSTYFSCSDYYWATYNELDTIASIRKAALPTLIINSLGDTQLYDADFTLWKKTFSADENVTLRVFGDQSHFGYKVDGTSSTAYYHKAEFPQELVDEIANFIKK